MAGGPADRAADLALRALIGAAMRLPYEARVPLAGRTLRRALGPLAGFRRRAEQQLALVWPDRPAADRRRIAGDCLDNLGRTLIENYSHAELHQRLATLQPEGDGLAAVDKAAQEKRPVLFVTGHFGNHEVPRHVLGHMGRAVGGLYRPMRNPFFDAHYARTMTDWGGPVFPQGRRGSIGFTRHIASGGMGTLLFDVNVDDGTPIPFLGRPAMTATSAADIALRTGAVMIPYFGLRQPDGLTFRCLIDAPIPDAAPEAMMAEANARLAARIEQHPGQWFWVHRRWKDKRGKIAASA